MSSGGDSTFHFIIELCKASDASQGSSSAIDSFLLTSMYAGDSNGLTHGTAPSWECRGDLKYGYVWGDWGWTQTWGTPAIMYSSSRLDQPINQLSCNTFVNSRARPRLLSKHIHVTTFDLCIARGLVTRGVMGTGRAPILNHHSYISTL